MALERKTLRAILEDETTDTSGKLKKILDVLHEETDTLQDQLVEKNAALAKAEKDRDAANSGKEAAEKALTDYKAQQTQKDTLATKAAAYKQLLKDNGVLEKHFDRVVKNDRRGHRRFGVGRERQGQGRKEVHGQPERRMG